MLLEQLDRGRLAEEPCEVQGGGASARERLKVVTRVHLNGHLCHVSTRGNNRRRKLPSKTTVTHSDSPRFILSLACSGVLSNILAASCR